MSDLEDLEKFADSLRPEMGRTHKWSGKKRVAARARFLGAGEQGILNGKSIRTMQRKSACRRKAPITLAPIGGKP